MTDLTTAATPEHASLWAAIPRGARLDARDFRSRHRINSAMLALHLPGLVAFSMVSGRGGLLVWGQLVALAVLLVLAQTLGSQTARASAVALGS